MKDQLNRFLLFAGLLFLALGAVSWIIDIRGLLFLPGCSMFCFQLLACRLTTGWGWRLMPLAVLLLWAGCGLLIAICGPGWDGLLGVLMLWASVAPAVGIALAWVLYLCLRRAVR